MEFRTFALLDTWHFHGELAAPQPGLIQVTFPWIDTEQAEWAYAYGNERRGIVCLCFCAYAFVCVHACVIWKIRRVCLQIGYV